MDVGTRIRELRKFRGLTTTTLGEMISASQQTISNYENNKSEPNIATIEAICNAMGINLPQFFDIEFIIEQDLKTLSPDIYNFISKEENRELVRFIAEMKEKGHSNEVIVEWLRTLNTALDKTVKMYGLGRGEGKVVWAPEELLPEGAKGKYAEEEKKDIADKLKKKLNDPEFVPPWNKDRT